MNYAVVLAGGVGSRMQTDGLPKQYIEVAGRPVIMYTMEQLERCPLIDRIVTVAADEWTEQISEWNAQYHITKHWAFAPPGSSRQTSTLNGLNVCMEGNPSDSDIVVVHESVRPLASAELIASCIETAAEYGGCVPVLPVKYTVYESKDGALISRLLDRNTLFDGQAPEAFRLKEYTELNRSCSLEELESCSGGSQLVHRHGIQVRMIPGVEMNLKLTTKKDLELFKGYIGLENGV